MLYEIEQVLYNKADYERAGGVSDPARVDQPRRSTHRCLSNHERTCLSCDVAHGVQPVTSLLIASSFCAVTVLASSISDLIGIVLDTVAAVVFAVLAAIAAVVAAILSLFGN